MNRIVYTTLAVAFLATCLSSAAPNAGEYEDNSRADDDDDLSNMLMPHYTLTSKNNWNDPRDSWRVRHNNIPAEGRVHLTRDSPKSPILDPKEPAASPVNDKSRAVDMEKVKSIAFNNREVKLVGKDRKEVEVKSDAATQMMLALENLQKEASDAWVKVNRTLDKGWTDFKTMVEDVVNKNSQKRATVESNSRHLRDTSSKDGSSIVMMTDIDGYSMADEDISKQAESAGNKIKGFFSNIGFNEENGKKANEALSKAGASVSETVTKDIPDALKKAGTAVSDTVTKDIPEAFKNFFG